MCEDLAVIGRVDERIALLRAEVEKRGLFWADDEVEDPEAEDAAMAVNGETLSIRTAAVGAASSVSGSLSDDELRRRLLSADG